MDSPNSPGQAERRLEAGIMPATAIGIIACIAAVIASVRALLSAAALATTDTAAITPTIITMTIMRMSPTTNPPTLRPTASKGFALTTQRPGRF